jgi:hypothetical protein
VSPADDRTSLRAEPFRQIHEIVRDSANTHENRALECLVALDRLPANDLAREDFRTAAQTFAMLALVDRIGYSNPGYNLVQAILVAGGVQP